MIAVLQTQMDWKSLFSKEKECRLCVNVCLYRHICMKLCVLVREVGWSVRWFQRLGWGQLKIYTVLSWHHEPLLCKRLWSSVAGDEKNGWEPGDGHRTLFTCSSIHVLEHRGLPLSKERVSLLHLLKDSWGVIGSPASLCPDFSPEVIHHWSACKHWRKHRITNFFHITAHGGLPIVLSCHFPISRGLESFWKLSVNTEEQLYFVD